MITENTLEHHSLDEWVEEFYTIYKEKDRKRTVQEVWLHLVENASKVGECIRTDDLKTAFKELAHVFCWLSSFVAKCNDRDASNNIKKVYLLDKPLSEIVWNKYPNICYKCGHNPCICPVLSEFPSDIDKRVEERRKQKHLMPKTLDEWIDMFKRIYEKAHTDLSIENICFHFLEEVGEVAREILKLSKFETKVEKNELSRKDGEELKKIKENLEKELADVFSWIASLISKLEFITGLLMEYHLSYRGQPIEENASNVMKIKLSRILWSAYKSPQGFLYCPPPYCQERPCKCPDF